MGEGRDRKTEQLEVHDRFMSEPPTAITNVADLRRVLGGDVWALTVLTGDRSGSIVELGSDPLVIGRGSESGIRPNDESLSRKHAAFAIENAEVWVRDLGSTNGTFLNGHRVEHPAKVGNGARVQLGMRTTVRVQLLHKDELAAAKALFESSTRDPLTGICNRRHLDERLESEVAFAERHRTPLSVLMIDIDHFKKINDTLGHPAGDAVLVHFGRLLSGAVRKEDLVARYGGEEFTVVLRDEGQTGAAILAERIRSMVEGSTVEWQDAKVRYTVSVGVASLDTAASDSATGLLERADRCLYSAKAAGRNAVVSRDSRSLD